MGQAQGGPTHFNNLSWVYQSAHFFVDRWIGPKKIKIKKINLSKSFLKIIFLLKYNKIISIQTFLKNSYLLNLSISFEACVCGGQQKAQILRVLYEKKKENEKKKVIHKPNPPPPLQLVGQAGPII